jgi:hypothetical protein
LQLMAAQRTVLSWNGSSGRFKACQAPVRPALGGARGRTGAMMSITKHGVLLNCPTNVAIPSSTTLQAAIPQMPFARARRAFQRVRMAKMICGPIQRVKEAWRASQGPC